MAVIAFRLKGQSYNATEHQISEAFSIAIDEVLGKNASSIVFKTAKLVYNTDYSGSLPYQVDSFQGFLRKALGEGASTRIMDAAISQMQKYWIR